MIIKQAVRAGQPVPERIQNAPSLEPGLELYYSGFLDLCSSRTIGMQASPISWVTVEEYCKAFHLDEEQVEAMHYHIQSMDQVYLETASKKKS
jgi:hypothetical protein